MTFVRPISKLRHEAIDNLRTVEQMVDDGLRAELREARHTLRGREGMTKDEQVEVLAQAEKTVTEKRGEVQAKLDALMAEFKERLMGSLEMAESALSEAVALAETRDFEAHQEAKREARATEYEYPSFGYDEDDEDDEDEDGEEY